MPNEETSIHREEYIYLAGLTHNTATIALGAFYFEVKGEGSNSEWEIIEDDDLHEFRELRADMDRRDLIGEGSKPYAESGTGEQAPVVLELKEESTGATKTFHYGRISQIDLNNLSPDTAYTYRVMVNGEEWGGGPLHDWKPDGDNGRMVLSGRSYENRFRTFPSPALASPKLTFAIIGDFGRGVKEGSRGELCQSVIAEALDETFEDNDIRFILTTGDNIYNISDQGSGDKDSDWFFTYFQPYRYILNRVPAFPCLGNHDEAETPGESSDDRRQAYGNFYIVRRFMAAVDRGEASLEPGLFYRFRFGSDIEFICLDTTKRNWLFGKRYFRHENHRPFIEAAFPASAPQPPKWRIPFFHHPPFCAGPSHHNDGDVISDLVPKFRRAGVRAVFSGHEHNFQYSADAGISYFVTGGSGKFRSGDPDEFDEAKTRAWGGNEKGHFLLVTVEGNRMEVTPITKETGRPTDKLPLRDAQGEELEDSLPIIVTI